MTDSTPLSEKLASLTPKQLAKLRSRLQQSPQRMVFPRAKVTDIPEGVRVYIDGREAWRATSSQARLWFLEQYLGPNPTYNVVRSIRLVGTLNLDALHAAFQHLIQRHEALRTTFHPIDGVLYQTIAASQECDWHVIDLQTVPEGDLESTFQECLKEWGRQPFDLTRDCLLRVRVFCLSQRQFGLQVVIHHIVSDGWTFGILAEELSALYRAFLSGQDASPLPSPTLQFADYSLWLYEQLESGKRDRNRQYWQTQLGGDLPTLDLPCDRPRGSEQTFNGRRTAIHFSRAETDALNTLARRSGASLFMVLLASFTVLLYRHTHQTDIIIGTPIANRDRPEL
ncbi:MAG: condensation domain-containing protein, partial [Cyanobacteria bacterium J06648_11]